MEQLGGYKRKTMTEYLSIISLIEIRITWKVVLNQEE